MECTPAPGHSVAVWVYLEQCVTNRHTTWRNVIMGTSATAGRDLFTPFGGHYLCCPLISRGGVFCGMPAFSISLIGLRGSLSFCFWVLILFDNKRIKQIPCGFANIRNKKILHIIWQ